MALSRDQLESIANNFIDKKLADGVLTSNALYAILKQPGKMKVRSGGLKIQAPLAYVDDTGSTGGWFDGAESLDSSRYDPITSSVHEWKQIHETLKLSHKELNQTSGDEGKLDLLKTRLDWMVKLMGNRFGKGAHSDGSGTSSKQLVGLEKIMDSSADYGDISISDLASWIPVVASNSGTNRSLTLPLHRNTIGQATEGEERPQLCFGRQNVINELADLLEPTQRLIVGEDKQLSGLGWKGDVIKYNGVKHIVDSKTKANTMEFLNTNHLSLYMHKDENFKRVTHKQLEDADAMQVRVLCMTALVCCNRRFQARLADISAT